MRKHLKTLNRDNQTPEEEPQRRILLPGTDRRDINVTCTEDTPRITQFVFVKEEALVNPLGGTEKLNLPSTSRHFKALHQILVRAEWERWCRGGDKRVDAKRRGWTDGGGEPKLGVIEQERRGDENERGVQTDVRVIDETK